MRTLLRMLLICQFLLVANAYAQPGGDGQACASSAGTANERLAACFRAATSGQLASRDLGEAILNGRGEWRGVSGNVAMPAVCGKAGGLRPQMAGIYLLCGLAWHYGVRENVRAVAALTRAIALSPQLAEAYFYRGVVSEDNGATDQAIADFSAAIRLKPEFADAFVQRALAWKSKLDNDRASADFKEANRFLARAH